MLRKFVGFLGVAIVASAFSVLPADAAKKAKKRSPAVSTTTPSLDGRITGYPRTCWHDYYLYDARGYTVGPYCH
jgi:hypothetical protein